MYTAWWSTGGRGTPATHRRTSPRVSQSLVPSHGCLEALCRRSRVADCRLNVAGRTGCPIGVDGVCAKTRLAGGTRGEEKQPVRWARHGPSYPRPRSPPNLSTVHA